MVEKETVCEKNNVDSIFFLRDLLTKKEGGHMPHLHYCAPGGIRTPNPLIRSQSLYPLSYEGVCFANYTAFQFSKPEIPFLRVFSAFFSKMQCFPPLIYATLNAELVAH